MSSNRVTLLTALVGSHNYNLNTLKSDCDYKVFVLPTFEDLYYGNQYSHDTIGEKADYSYRDIRKLGNLLWKANVNFLEVLFSTGALWNPQDEQMNTLYSMKDDIARMNLPYLYSACIGMFYNKIKYLYRGTEGTKQLVEKFGYDTKQALHAYRILDFLRRFADNGFTDFRAAIWYEGSERDAMLEIKNGRYTETQFGDMVHELLGDIDLRYNATYKDHEPNLDTKKKVEELIFSLVRDNLARGNDND